MSTEYIHELGDCLSTSGSNAGPHVKVIAPEKYKESGSDTYKTISTEIEKVKQTEDHASTDAGYELLFSGTSDSTTRTEGTRKSNNLTFQPSTGTLTATTFNGTASVAKSYDASFYGSNSIASSLGSRVYGKTVRLGNGEGLSINMANSLHTGRSTALVLMSGNNGRYSLVELGWFKGAGTDSAIGSITNLYSHVLATYATDNDSVPKVYVNTGTIEYGCGIYLVMTNTGWSTQATVMLNCENMLEVSIGTIDRTVAMTTTDVSGNTVFNLDDRLVIGSSSSASWSGDDTHLPTRGAVQDKLDGKVNIANIDLSGQTTTLLSKVQEMGNTAVHYRRYYTTGDASAAGISDKPVSGSGFLVEILCNRRNNANDWRYALIGYSLGHKPYFASVSNLDTSISWTQILSWDRVRTSSDTSSWSSDNSNVPTRAAVEAKISNAISGNVGGFLGSWMPAGVQYYQSANDFKNGDWVSITQSGSVSYYKNNDRTQSYTILPVNTGDDIYWTTEGEFQKKASTAVQIYPTSELSDWNDLTSSGLYQISVSGATRAPATGTFSCLVSNENGNIRQVAFNSTNIYYRGKASSGQAWTDWKNVDSVTHAANATTAANYITDQSTTVSIHYKFTYVDNQIYDISNYKKIRVVNNLPSSPDSDTIYFI